MAKQNNFLGIESVAFGLPGANGAMGAELTEYNDIEVNSIVLEGSTANETTISTETNDNYITVDDIPTPTRVTIRIYGLSAEDRVTFMGGKVGDAEDVGNEGHYMAPAKKSPIYLSLKMKGKEIDGKQAVLKIPYGKIAARDQGNITRNGLPAVEVVVTANTVSDDASPYILGFEDVV